MKCLYALTCLVLLPSVCTAGLLSFWDSGDDVAVTSLFELPFLMAENNAPWDTMSAVLQQRQHIIREHATLLKFWRELEKEPAMLVLQAARKSLAKEHRGRTQGARPKWLEQDPPVMSNHDALRNHLALPLAGQSVTQLHSVPFSLQSAYSGYSKRASFPPEFMREWQQMVEYTEERCKELDSSFSQLPSSFGDESAASLFQQHLIKPAHEIMHGELGPLVGTQQQQYATLKHKYEQMLTSVQQKEALQQKGLQSSGLAKERQDLCDLLAHQLLPSVRELRHLVKNAHQRQLPMHLTSNLTSGLDQAKKFRNRLEQKRVSLQKDIRAHEAYLEGTWLLNT